MGPTRTIDYKAVALRSLDKLPPFPASLSRLRATLADEEVTFARVSEVIEKDSVLAGHVLRVVNSALYARTGTVNSVGHAVSLLGISKLRNMALTLAVTSLWGKVKTPPGWSLKKFNLHSVATAVMADLLATKMRVPYAEGAFTAGLFHDVGKLLIAVVFPDQYERIARANWAPSIEQEFLGINHAELSFEIMVRWKLPREIQDAVGGHHCQIHGPSHLMLADLIHVADEFTILRGISIDAREEGDASMALAGVGIDEKIPRLCSEFDQAFESIKSFF